MELHAIEDITTPCYHNLYLHAREHLTFHDVSGPLQITTSSIKSTYIMNRLTSLDLQIQ